MHKIAKVFKESDLILEIRLRRGVIWTHKYRRLDICQKLVPLGFVQPVKTENRVLGKADALFRVAAAHLEIVVEHLVRREAHREMADTLGIGIKALLQHRIGAEVFHNNVFSQYLFQCHKPNTP